MSNSTKRVNNNHEARDKKPPSNSKGGGGGVATTFSGQSMSTSGSVGSPSRRSHEAAMATPVSDNKFLRLNNLDTQGDDDRSQGAMSNRKKKRGQRAAGGDKSGRGLRQFSLKVCEKVESKGRTTYNEVADELLVEFVDPNNGVASLDQMVSGQGQTTRTERRNHFTWLHRNYKKNPNHTLPQHLDAMEKIYRGARANDYQFHRDEIVYHLDRTLTPYWRQFIKRIEETFDYQTSLDVLLRCMRERWRVNREDLFDTNRALGYEQNPNNVLPIHEVNCEGQYVEDEPSEEYSPASHSALTQGQTPREINMRVLMGTIS